MQITFLRRAPLVALACLLVASAVAPVAAGERTVKLQKLEPRRVVPYRVGRTFKPDTNVLSVSGYAAWMIDEVLAATTPLPRLGAAFMKAERKHGINARYFLAHAFLESGWGTSDIARLKRNLFGYNAFDRDPWKHATRYRTYEAGIRSVAEKLREGYLAPDGRWWYRFTTARAINRYYASDPRWADKVARTANIIDQLVVTLRERGLRFGRPTLTAAPAAGDRLGVDVPWRANPGAELPAAIRFAVRWTPLALLETAADGPAEAPRVAWRLVRRANRPGDVVRLAAQAPALPGLWRLDVEARDSDGASLPKTDARPIRSLVVRVTADREAALALRLAADGSLEATVRNAGRVPIEADGGGLTTTLEAWALPLDPALPAHRLGAVDLGTALEPGGQRTLSFAPPAIPAVVVARLAGDPAALGRTLPAAALLARGKDGQPALTPLAPASPRDDALLGRSPAADRLAMLPVEAPGALRVLVPRGEPVPEIREELATAEGIAGRPLLLVRSLAAQPELAAAPTDTLLGLPEDAAAPAADATGGLVVDVGDMPPGIRLVMAALVPLGEGLVDPTTIGLAWVVVASPPTVAPDPS